MEMLFFLSKKTRENCQQSAWDRFTGLRMAASQVKTVLSGEKTENEIKKLVFRPPEELFINIIMSVNPLNDCLKRNLHADVTFE